MVTRKKSGGGSAGAKSLKLVLRGQKAEEEAPVLALYAISRDGDVVGRAEARSGDTIDLEAAALSKAEAVAVLSSNAEPTREALSAAYRVSAAQIARLKELRQPLELSPARWRPLLPFIRCVDGKVQKCWWWPFYVQALNERTLARTGLFQRGVPEVSIAGSTALQPLGHQLPFHPPIFRRCKPVCEGLVEVYQRICCCHIVITPPIIIDLIDRLREIIRRLPDPIPDPDPGPIRPPRPQPDPVPFERAGMFRGGVVDDVAIKAETDLRMLSSAQFEHAESYIRARPHLMRILCGCGSPVFKGSTLIGPGGAFSLCYLDSPYLLANCHIEWAFRVRQVIDGVDIVVYDGVASDQWFEPGDEITLTTHDPRAVDCDDTPAPVPDDAPFVMLEDIGSTDAWHLKTPAPTGWDRAAVTSYNDGLSFPAASVAAARGTYLNRNWGGTLPLRYLITEPMKAAGARYYRVSVIRADALGNPTGARHYESRPISWQYYESLGGFPPLIKIGQKQLNLEDDPTFYEIPYRSDRNWLSAGFHAFIDTTKFDDSRHLVSLELYDAGRNRIVPNNALDPAGGDTARAFTYEWWWDNPAVPGAPEATTNVPYAGLTHMFWWDNRRTVAKIVDLRKDGVANTAECQFMSGDTTTQFSAGFRAYHPHDWFMHSYRLWWRRGLGGSAKDLEVGYSNVGVSPGPQHESQTESFDEMLNYSPSDPGDTLPADKRNEKCTFSLLLHVDVKTFNGSSILNGLDSNDVASFALDIS